MLRAHVTLGFLALLTSTLSAHAAPSNLPDRALTLELREVAPANLFALLGQVSQREVALDACVSGKLDLVMRNAPQSVVWDAVAEKLLLT